MLLITGKEILEGINLKLDETLQELCDNSSELLSEKDKTIGSYEEKISNLKLQVKELEIKNKELSTRVGGLTAGNSRLSKDKEILKEKLKNQNKVLKTKEELIKKLESEKYDKEKMQIVIEELEKLNRLKSRPVPTKEQIINYDKKNPQMK